MAILGFHHVAVYTEDFEKSKAFYAALGARQVHSFFAHSGGKEISLMELCPGATVEIIQAEAPRTEGSFPHLAIATDNCEECFEKAVAAGASVKSEVKEMMLGTMAVKNCFLYGPDGETIEFFQVL